MPDVTSPSNLSLNVFVETSCLLTLKCELAKSLLEVSFLIIFVFILTGFVTTTFNV